MPCMRPCLFLSFLLGRGPKGDNVLENTEKNYVSLSIRLNVCIMFVLYLKAPAPQDSPRTTALPSPKCSQAPSPASRASIGQQYPFLCCIYFIFPKYLQHGRGYWWSWLAPARIYSCNQTTLYKAVSILFPSFLFFSFFCFLLFFLLAWGICGPGHTRNK